MPSLSPNPLTGSGSSSPRPAGGHASRPSLAKRHSSQSTVILHRMNASSPGSANEHYQLTPKHAVRTARHPKIVLPRNHSSGRNLAKLARQVQQQQEGERRHARNRSHEHEGDTEIRLPGSLEDTKPPPMRRNLTANQLPRTTSHVKLKKNLSHGHLSRLQSAKNLSALSSTHQKAPLSPGLKGKSKRPKSTELARQELNLHEQEANILRKQEQERLASHRIGFAVGDADDRSDDEEVADMEGSGLQEDEWTEESASASPFSTRQNTANNSRRASVIVTDKATDRFSPLVPRGPSGLSPRKKPSNADQHSVVGPAGHAEVSVAPPEAKEGAVNARQAGSEDSEEDEAQGERNESDDEYNSGDQTPDKGSTSPLSMPRLEHTSPTEDVLQEPSHSYQKQQVAPKPPQRSPLHSGAEQTNPATRRILSRNQQLPAPALISNINTLDDGHHSYESTTASRRSSKSQTEGGSVEGEDELVSRFIPSTSHPALGSGMNTTSNTPRQGGFLTPLEEHMRRSRGQPVPVGPTSPGSTISGSSGAATPALGRSRIELKMLGEKALADREAVAERAPIYPHHVYDRRNETLKSYLNVSSVGRDGRGGVMPATSVALGPEIFQGRFKAVNTELKVVLKFRDPIVESAERLRHIKGTKLHQLATASRQQRNAPLKTSKSAVTLPSRHASRLSTSTTPPAQVYVTASATTANSSENVGGQQNGPGTMRAGDVRRAPPRRGVSFAGAPVMPESSHRHESREAIPAAGPDEIARQLWDSLF